MSNFANPFTTEVISNANFGAITNNNINIFPCIDGKLAGFRIINVGTNEDPYYISQIYDSTDGNNLLIGTTCVQAGWDMSGGLFLTGCIPDRDPLDAECVFYLTDY